MKRNPSIELLRCLTMGLIVGYHCFVHGIYSETHTLWSLFFTTFVCWHVDTFLAISGWFGIKFSWKKIIRLWGLMVFYSLLSLVYGAIWGGKDISMSTFTITGGWFGGTYLALFLLAPMLNKAVQSVVQDEGPDSRWKIWGLFSAIVVLAWLPRRGFSAVAPGGVAGMHGYSLMTFVFIYVSVRMLRLSCERNDHWMSRWSSGRLVLTGVCFFIGMFALFLGMDTVSWLTGHGHLSEIGTIFSSYDAPHVWIMAIAVLLFFVYHVKVPAWLGKIATFCAPSMFGVYLLHDTTSFGHEIFRVPERWLAANTALHPALIILLAAVWTFAFCLMVDLARRAVLKGVEGVKR